MDRQLQDPVKIKRTGSEESGLIIMLMVDRDKTTKNGLNKEKRLAHSLGSQDGQSRN